MTYNSKLHLLWIICHIWVIAVLAYNFSWAFLLIGYVWYVVIKGIGSEAGAHRYFTHCSFKTKLWKEKLMLWLQTLCGEGSVLTFVGMHRMHHAFSDTPNDPHSPHHKPWYKVMYFIDTLHVQPRLLKGVSKNVDARLQHKIYFKLHVLLMTIGIFFPVYYGYFVALPLLLSIYTNALVNIGLHKFGTKLENSRDESRNSAILNLILFGAGYHANHHNNAGLYYYDNRWYVDIVGYMIRKTLLIKA